MAIMDIVDEVYKLPIDVAANGTIEKTLQTADTYVDKNIKVIVNTPDATFKVVDEGAVTATVSTTDTVYTSDTETPYAIVIAADAEVTDVKVGVDQAGFAAESDVVTVAGSAAEQNTKTIYVKEGSLTGSGAAEAAGNVQLVKVAAQPDSGFYVKASGTGNVEVATAGWVDPENTDAIDTGAEAFYTVKSAVLSNNETGDFAEVDAPVLTEDGYLFINEGYIANTKISLATLVPDDANITSENADKVYNTVKAYDKDGKLIVGTMGDAELGAITADDAVANVATVAVAANDDATAFVVTGTGAISGTASVEITKRGLAETTLGQSGVIEGEASVEASIAKIGIGVSADDSDVEVTPVIVKADATTVKSGDIATEAPEGYYVAVNTEAITQSVTVTPTVLTEGYGTADVHSATGATVKAGAAASGTYYVPVTAGSHVIEEGESQIVNATATVATTIGGTKEVSGILTAAPSGDYITIGTDTTVVKGSVTTSSTCTVTEGYVANDVKTTTISGDVEVQKTEAAAKYIRIYDGSFI